MIWLNLQEARYFDGSSDLEGAFVVYLFDMEDPK